MSKEIKKYPQASQTYQVVHLDKNNEVILESEIFEYLYEAREFAYKKKTALGFGEVDWKIIMIQKSVLDVDINYQQGNKLER